MTQTKLKINTSYLSSVIYLRPLVKTIKSYLSLNSIVIKVKEKRYRENKIRIRNDNGMRRNEVSYPIPIFIEKIHLHLHTQTKTNRYQIFVTSSSQLGRIYTCIYIHTHFPTFQY